MATIGFIGIGNMGGPMVRNLVQAGHAVKAFDLSEDALNFAVQAGGYLRSRLARKSSCLISWEPSKIDKSFIGRREQTQPWPRPFPPP